MQNCAIFSEDAAAQVARMARLLAAVPATGPRKAALVMLPEGLWAQRVAEAAQAAQLPLLQLAPTADTAAVASSIAQHQPSVLVCATDVFGWVSKLGFTQGVTAVFTCGPEGQGSLLERAAHC